MEAEGGVTTEKEKAEGRERVMEPSWRDGGRRHKPRNAGDPQKPDKAGEWYLPWSLCQEPALPAP